MSTACAPLQARPKPALRSVAPIQRQADCDCAEQQTAEQPGLPRYLMSRGVQTKLTVGARDDPLEREADAFADSVLHAESTPAVRLRDGSESLRRLCAGCAEAEQGADAEPSGSDLVQRAMHGGGDDGAGSGADDDIGDPSAGGSAGGSGAPLPPPVRHRLEGAAGIDLAGVRVHDDAPARGAAQALHAKAFTHGEHIWLGRGQRADDLGLMAHEVAHVVQQTSGRAEQHRLQRAPADYRHPEDGGNVAGRMQSRIAEASEDAETDEDAPADPAARAHQARSAATQVDRGEMASERAEVEPDARPDVNRPAAEAPKIEQATSEAKQEADSPAEPIAEGDPGAAEAGAKGKGKAVSAADAAASAADAAFAAAGAVPQPPAQAVVTPPQPVAPIDAGGQPLPGDPSSDAALATLADQAQELRTQGTQVRAFAGEERANASVLEGNLALVRGGVTQAEQGTAKSNEHLAFRQGLASQARGALAVAEQKAATVAAEAPDYASTADEGKAESGPMAGEAGELSAENAANTPDDPEAAAEAREQGGQMNQAGSDIASTDSAISQTQTKAASLGEDAARATQTNTATAGKLDAMDATLASSGEKLGQMTAQSTQARAGIAALAAAPRRQAQQAGTLDEQGGTLVNASFDIEARVQATQREYEQAMRSVPKAEEPRPDDAVVEGAMQEPTLETAADEAAPVQREPESATSSGDGDVLVQREPEATAAPEPPQADSTEPDSVAVDTAADAGPQAADAAGAAPDAATPADAASDATAPQADAEGAEPLLGGGTEPAAAAPPSPPERERVDAAGAVTGALPEWMTGAQAPNADQRETAAQAAEERRQRQIAEIEAMAGGNYASLSAAGRMGVALRMTGRNLFGSASNIQWPGWGHLALGLVDPRGPMMGVVSGLGMMLSGGANLFSAEQWRRDPLGNLLKSAADIATGLTIVLGSITALAGVIIAIMVAITILSFGTAAPVTGPVIAFCTTVLTTVGGWTIAVGKVALVLQALVFIKNLIDAACADTAAELQRESDQMTENVGDAANVLLQMGMAKAGQVGGRAASAEISAAGGGVRYAAQMGARAGVGARAGLGAAGRGARALPGAVARGARALPGAAARGARALPGAVARGARALPGAALRGAGSLGRSTLAGARSLGAAGLRGARSLGSRAVAGARALPGRALAAARALPGRAVAGARALPSRVVAGVRGLPGRMRQSFGRGLSREFLLGDDVANLGMARGASAEARAGVYAEARVPGGSAAARARNAAPATVTQRGNAAAFHNLPPDRLPANLPEGHFWMRNADGSEWTLMRDAGTQAAPFELTVYADASGNTNYVLRSNGRLIQSNAITRSGSTHGGTDRLPPDLDEVGVNNPYRDPVTNQPWDKGHGVDHADTLEGPGVLSSTTDIANFTPQASWWNQGPRNSLVGRIRNGHGPSGRAGGGGYREMARYAESPPVTSNGTLIPREFIFVETDAAGVALRAWRIPNVQGAAGRGITAIDAMAIPLADVPPVLLRSGLPLAGPGGTGAVYAPGAIFGMTAAREIAGDRTRAREDGGAEAAPVNEPVPSP